MKKKIVVLVESLDAIRELLSMDKELSFVDAALILQEGVIYE